MTAMNLELLILIATGAALTKLGLINKPISTALTNLVVDVFLPCSIILSFSIDLSLQQFKQALQVLIASIFIQLFYAWLCRHLWSHQPESRKAVLRYATMVSNAGFLGMPFAQAVYGDLGLLYASIFLIPQRIVMWSAGLSLFHDSSKKEVIRHVALHPCIIALEIGLVVLAANNLGFALPEWLRLPLQALASCSTPLCMLVIGSLILQDFSPSFFSKESLLYCALRLLILPALIFAVLKLLHFDSLAVGVCTLLSAMPAAATTAMLANKYDKDGAYASSLVALSTLLSLITLPLVIAFLNWM